MKRAQSQTGFRACMRGLRFSVAGVEARGVCVFGFAPRRHVLSQSEWRLHVHPTLCHHRRTYSEPRPFLAEIGAMPICVAGQIGD